MSKRNLTTTQAAAALGVTVGRVRQMVLAGLIQAERFGRALMIPESEITKAKRRKTKPGPAAKKGKGKGIK